MHEFGAASSKNPPAILQADFWARWLVESIYKYDLTKTLGCFGKLRTFADADETVRVMSVFLRNDWIFWSKWKNRHFWRALMVMCVHRAMRGARMQRAIDGSRARAVRAFAPARRVDARTERSLKARMVIEWMDGHMLMAWPWSVVVGNVGFLTLLVMRASYMWRGRKRASAGEQQLAAYCWMVPDVGYWFDCIPLALEFANIVLALRKFG